MRTIVTVTGIRPDFIRMSEVFKLLDKEFNHILVHTGQHYDKMLSDVFFDELDIREPDYNLGIGGSGKEHFHQLADVSVKLIELLRTENICPDLILFLGDSNSALVAAPLKKEGYKIGHIEAGMRSYDKRMLEEINRICCDHCSSMLFVYHTDYKDNLLKENITSDNIYVVGNTIVDVCDKFKKEICSSPKTNDFILMDIHRPENFNYKNRMVNIINYANKCSVLFNVPVRMLSFKRTIMKIEEYDIDLRDIQLIDLLSYKNFLREQYNSLFMISDSGTAQEEPALLGTPVIVPRDYTERPQSEENNCSIRLDFNDDKVDALLNKTENWLSSLGSLNLMKTDWLGDGTTAEQILFYLKRDL